MKKFFYLIGFLILGSTVVGGSFQCYSAPEVRVNSTTIENVKGGE